MNIFGRFAYEAIEKCIVPARYRQIIDTESTEKLDTLKKQIYRKISNTSTVAKIHYQKCRLEDIVAKAKNIMDKLRNKSESLSVINSINFDTESSASNNASLGSNDSTKVGTFSVNKILYSL